jgi:hypothetical protein
MIDLLSTVYAVITLVMLYVRFETGLLLLLPMVPLTTYAYRSPITGLNATNLLIYSAFGLSLLRRMGQPGRGLPPATLPIVIFFSATLLAWLVGIVNYGGRNYSAFRNLINVERWMLYMLLYFTYFFGWSGKIPVRTAFRWLFAGIVLAAAYNLVELVHPSTRYLLSERNPGLFRQANSNGIFMASYLFLAPALMAGARKSLYKWFYGGIFLLCIYGMVLSLSRAAFLSFTFAALAYAYFRSRRMFVALLLAVLILVPTYTVVLPAKVADRIAFTFRGSPYKGLAGEFEGSAANRVVQSIAAAKLFLDSPIIGHGLGGFWHRSSKYLPPGAPPVARALHTTFFWALVDGGMPVVLSFFWLLANLALEGKRLYASRASEADRLLGLYLITIVVAKTVANFFNTEFLTGDVSAYLWIAGGLVSWKNMQIREAAEEVTERAAPVRIRSSWRPRGSVPLPSRTRHG